MNNVLLCTVLSLQETELASDYTTCKKVYKKYGIIIIVNAAMYNECACCSIVFLAYKLFTVILNNK